MANTIGSIVVELIAETAKFRTDLERARKDVTSATNDITKRLTSIESTMKGLGSAFGATIGAVIGVGGFGALIKSSLDAADALNDSSQRIGINIEALQELQHAAKMSGVSAEEMETAISKLNKKVGEAAIGSKEASQFFKDLGISVTTSSGAIRTTEQVFTDVIEKLKNTDSAAERTRIAMEAFGKSGARLLPMIHDMEALRAEAQRLGLVISEDMVKDAAEANDALDKLQRVLKTQVTAAVAQLAPMIVGLANAISELGAGWKTVWERMADETRAPAEEIANRIAEVQEKIEGLRRTRESMLPGFGAERRKEEIDKEVKTLRAEVARLRAVLRGRVKEERDERNAAQAPAGTATEPIDMDKIAAEQQKGWVAMAEAVIKETEDELKALERLTDQRIADEAKAHADSIKGWVEYADAVIKELEDRQLEDVRLLDEKLAEEKKAQEESIKGWVAHAEAVIKETEEAQLAEVEILDKRIEAEKKAAEATKKEWDSVADSISNAFSNSFRGVMQGTQTLEKAFSNMGQNIALSLIENVINRGIKKVSDALWDLVEEMQRTGLIKSIIGAIGGAFGGVGNTGPTGQTFAAEFAGGLRPMAEGGIVRRPTPALVGEAGPEAVIPLDRLASGSSSPGVIVQVIDQRRSGTIEQEDGGTSADGRRILRMLVRDEVKQAIGSGSLDRSMASTYGVGRRGVVRD